VARLALLLNKLEKHYGKLPPPRLTDPYLMIVFANCAYPATDAGCTKGFDILQREIGTGIDDILGADDADLIRVMKGHGMFPEMRAARLREIASLVKSEYGGDLKATLRGPLPQARRALKRFPTIGDPGADRILLFTGTAPIAAVPSNCVRVAHRLGYGEEKKNYAAGYRSAQEAIRAELPENCDVLIRAYQLLKHHGQELCKTNQPLCRRCPVSSECVWFNR
jgi:endonuclease-3